MPEPKKWFLTEVRSLPRDIAKEEWVGKEIYVYRREHEVYGVMWIEVIASNGKEAQEIIDDITK